MGKHRGELTWREREQSCQNTWCSPRQPAMNDGNCKLNVAHMFAAGVARSYFDPAPFTDKSWCPFMAILSTCTRPVLERTKYPLTKESPWFRLVRQVIDGCCFSDLTITPGADLLWGCETDAQSHDSI